MTTESKGDVVNAQEEPEGPYGFIQWKGTDVCMDLHCACGCLWHVDAEFAYFTRCPRCGASYEVMPFVHLRRVSDAEADAGQLRTEDYDEARHGTMGTSPLIAPRDGLVAAGEINEGDAVAVRADGTAVAVPRRPRPMFEGVDISTVLDVAPVVTSGTAILRVGGEEMAVDIGMLQSLGAEAFRDGIVTLSAVDFAHWRRAHDLAGVVSPESLRATASPGEAGAFGPCPLCGAAVVRADGEVRTSWPPQWMMRCTACEWASCRVADGYRPGAPMRGE